MTNIKLKIKYLYKKIQSIKIYLWSHYLALLGFLFSPALIILKSEYPDITYFLLHVLLMIVFLYTPFLILLLFEKFYYPIYMEKLIFLYKNPIYNILWLIGFSLGLIFNFSILFTIGYFIFN